ncbi:MAG: hypothetical protein WCT50_01805 [Patescibacteria group bacterium]|jgi:hypothetical protein
MKAIAIVLIFAVTLGLMSCMLAAVSGDGYQMSMFFGWICFSAMLLMWGYLTIHEEKVTMLEVASTFFIIAVCSAVAYIWVLEHGDIITVTVLIETVKVLVALLVAIKLGNERLSSGRLLLGLIGGIIMIDWVWLIMTENWFNENTRILITTVLFPIGIITWGIFINRTKHLIIKKSDIPIDRISQLETSAVGQRAGLEFCFFPLAAVIIWLYIRQITTPLTDPLLLTDHDAAIVANIIFILMAFVVLLVAGYISHWLLGKRLDFLWEEKQKLI